MLHYTKHIPPILCSIIGIMFILNFAAIFYGLPQILDPDEQIFAIGAGRMLSPNYGDPKWYGAPAGTLMSMMAVLFVAYIIVLKIFFDLLSPLDHFLTNFSDYIFIGRLISITFFSLSSMAFCTLAQRLFKHKNEIIFATLCFIFSPYFLHLSQITRMDIIMVFAIIMIFHFSLNIKEKASIPSFIWSGIALGAAVTSKYPGIIGVLCIIWSTFLAKTSKKITWSKGFLLLSLAAMASLVAAFIFSPYIFLNFKGMLEDVIFEARTEHIGHDGKNFFEHLIFYLTVALPKMCGWGVFVTSLGGLFLFSINKLKPHAFQIIFIFGICFLLFICSLSLHWIRWAYPLTPVIALFATYFVSHLKKWLHNKFSPRTAQYAFYITLFIVLFPSFFSSMHTTFLRIFDKDTRIESEKWVIENIDQGSTILIDTYAPQLHINSFNVLIAKHGEINKLQDAEDWQFIRPRSYYEPLGSTIKNKQLEEIFANDIDYILLSDFDQKYLKFGDEAAEYVYTYIFDHFKPIKTFYPSFLALGPKTSILARKKEVTK